MANVVVWSERDEPYGDKRFRDCTYSAYLMGLVYGGKTVFPKGIYTVAEREALERADDRPDETGSNYPTVDVASSRRYGKVLKIPTITLAAALKRTGYGLGLSGENGNLPSTNSLRRWDKPFTGGHAVFVIPLGNGTVRWYDPLGPWKFGGDIATVATVLKWVGNRTSAYNWREIKEDSFSADPGNIPPVVPAPVDSYTLRIAPNTTILIASLSSAGCILGWSKKVWGSTASTAPCLSPRTLQGCSSGSAQVAYVTAGAFKGQRLRVGNGVTVVSS